MLLKHHIILNTQYQNGNKPYLLCYIFESAKTNFKKENIILESGSYLFVYFNISSSKIWQLISAFPSLGKNALGFSPQCCSVKIKRVITLFISRERFFCVLKRQATFRDYFFYVIGFFFPIEQEQTQCKEYCDRDDTKMNKQELPLQRICLCVCVW